MQSTLIDGATITVDRATIEMSGNWMSNCTTTDATAFNIKELQSNVYQLKNELDALRYALEELRFNKDSASNMSLEEFLANE